MADEYIGVYHADGGIVGEAKYIVGHLLGRVHCSLCDITHSPVRRKREWDRFVTGLGVPFHLYHLNEMPPDVAAVVQTSGSPVVLVRDAGGVRVILSAADLDQMDGSVAELARALARSETR